eukprot:gnl/TRDRNA2_/TRDRNA2_189713_c0_seq1.p1 gnl/TRDRNA2_/TRDRNA2_189713_c0~~gnl/TRDRNA2_/TRDRNA2_189713_c0_seq1.p1  ORF type:complete len:293 (+),score=50.29 gnl/TRDRNA2_/TRDRNA2_189713_c0_seq1:109-987(+)
MRILSRLVKTLAAGGGPEKPKTQSCGSCCFAWLLQVSSGNPEAVATALTATVHEELDDFGIDALVVALSGKRTDEIPASLAAAVKRGSQSEDEIACAIAGIAGSVLAAGLGAADGLGLSDELRTFIMYILIKEELTHLARIHGSRYVSVDADLRPASERKCGKRDLIDLTVEWCATPAVPTYGYGYRFARGDPSAADDAAACAWVLRLLFHRTGRSLAKEAPICAEVCSLLCEQKDPKGFENFLKEATRLRKSKTGLRRRISLGDGDGKVSRQVKPENWRRRHTQAEGSDDF